MGLASCPNRWSAVTRPSTITWRAVALTSSSVKKAPRGNTQPVRIIGKVASVPRMYVNQVFPPTFHHFQALVLLYTGSNILHARHGA